MLTKYTRDFLSSAQHVDCLETALWKAAFLRVISTTEIFVGTVYAKIYCQQLAAEKYFMPSVIRVLKIEQHKQPSSNPGTCKSYGNQRGKQTQTLVHKHHAKSSGEDDFLKTGPQRDMYFLT